MPANYNLRCRWDQTFRLPRDFSPYDTQLQAGAIARMEMTFANGYVLEFSSNSGDGKDGTFVYDSYKKGWFICPLNKLAALYATFGGSSKALSATWAARLEKDGASQVVMSGRAIWAAPDINETGDSSSTGTGTGTFGQTVFVDGEVDGVTPPLPIDFSTAVAMATQLAQDWATKTSAEVVAGQGYGAKKYAIDALASYTSALAIAAGLSASPYAYMLDGVNPAALFSAPKGLFMLSGAIVALSSLLSFSSAAKYTVGPDGNYVLNASNGPAWDWSTGRRRLLVEAIGATNYWLNSENGAAWGLINGASASTAANALFGTLSLTTLTSGAAAVPGASANAGIAAVNGDVISVTTAFIAGDLSDPVIQLYGLTSGDGLNADSVASILSGPGALTQIVGGMFHLTGLSTTVPTIVRVTRTYRTSETAAAYIYMTRNLPSGDLTPGAGHTLKMGRPQFEPGYGSSYIVSGATPTARAADVVTATAALRALLTAANAALAARGAILTTSVGALDVIGSTSTYGAIAAIDGTGRAALVDPAGAHVLAAAYPASFANKNFGVAATWLPAGKRKVSSGTDVVSDNYQLFNGDTGLQLSGTVDGPSNMLLDEIVVWPIFASDAGLQAQARVYS